MIIDVRQHYSNFPSTVYINGIEYMFDICNLSKFIRDNYISHINVNHLIWSRNLKDIIGDIILLIHNNALKLTIYIHDYYSVCPSTMLLDYKMEYCSVPSIDVCVNCLAQYSDSEKAFQFSKNEIKANEVIHRGSIYRWRVLWETLLDLATTVIFPSRVAADIWLKAFPRYSDRVLVLPHDLEYIAQVKVHKQIKLDPFYQIFILGNISEHKGQKIIHGLLKLVKQGKLNICINILGTYSDDVFINTPYLKLHGLFKHSDIANILNSKDIHCFLMTSIWPETFSYTTHEMMATGLPIIAFNIGAQGEVIADYPTGELLNDISVNALFNLVSKKYNEYLKLLYPLLSKELTCDIRKEVDKVLSETLELQHRVIKNKLEHDIELCVVQRGLNNVQCELNNVQCELNNKQNELQGIYNSKSWKITKPLRLIINIIKNANKSSYRCLIASVKKTNIKYDK